MNPVTDKHLQDCHKALVIALKCSSDFVQNSQSFNETELLEALTILTRAGVLFINELELHIRMNEQNQKMN